MIHVVLFGKYCIPQFILKLASADNDGPKDIQLCFTVLLHFIVVGNS